MCLCVCVCGSGGGGGGSGAGGKKKILYAIAEEEKVLTFQLSRRMETNEHKGRAAFHSGFKAFAANSHSGQDEG